MIILVVVFFSLVCAKPFLVVDGVISVNQCDEIINEAHRQDGTKHGILKTHDAELHAVFSTYASKYIDAQAIRPFHVNSTLRDRGHQWVALTNAKDTLIVDSPDSVFGAILFLNDNVAGGHLSIETGVPDKQQPLVVQPSCGRLVIFPSTYALPKTVQRIKLGTLYLVNVYFYAVPPRPVE